LVPFEPLGYKEQAMDVAIDLDLKFELAVQLGKLEIAYEIARESDSDAKWKQLSDLAIGSCQFGLAEECMLNAEDLSGLLLYYTSVGNGEGIRRLATLAAEKGRNNIAFVSYLLLGEVDSCLRLLVETGRVAEAAFLARTYRPRYVSIALSLPLPLSLSLPRVCVDLLIPVCWPVNSKPSI
jgi:coatomer subunit beta'